MATTTKRRSAGGAQSKSARQRALDRLNKSLEGAQKAAKAVRKDVTVGGRDLARDVERMITQTRRDVTKLEKAVRADLADFERTVAGRKPARSAARSPRKRSPRKRSTASQTRRRPATRSGAR